MPVRVTSNSCHTSSWGTSLDRIDMKLLGNSCTIPAPTPGVSYLLHLHVVTILVNPEPRHGSHGSTVPAVCRACHRKCL